VSDARKWFWGLVSRVTYRVANPILNLLLGKGCQHCWQWETELPHEEPPAQAGWQHCDRCGARRWRVKW
jgi:hypothetical protein